MAGDRNRGRRPQAAHYTSAAITGNPSEDKCSSHSAIDLNESETAANSTWQDITDQQGGTPRQNREAVHHCPLTDYRGVF